MAISTSYKVHNSLGTNDPNLRSVGNLYQGEQKVALSLRMMIDNVDELENTEYAHTIVLQYK